MLARIVAVTAILALAYGLAAPPARSDGDPASDVLATEPLFLPQDAGVPANRQAELTTLLQAAGRRGYQIRVAMIASASDLGSVTELWRRPQEYAQFLGQELSIVYRGPLLVVMPNGFGLYRVNRSIGGDRSALAGLGPSSGGAELATVAVAAIERLAASSGHPLPPPAASAPSAPGSSDLGAWIAFLGGCVLIALAWSASLRARPPRLGRGGATTG